MRMTSLLLAALLLTLSPAQAKDKDGKVESPATLQLRVVAPSQIPLPSYDQESKPELKPRKMPTLTVSNPDQTRFSRSRLQLPPQSWPYPMVQMMNPHPVLPGTAGW